MSLLITGESCSLVKKVDCSNCAALCCRSVTMPLTDAEAGFMRDGGTDLVEVGGKKRRLLPIFPSRRTQDYRLQGDCGRLTTDEESGQLVCNSHDDPDRPQVCQEFAPGSFRCRELRVAAGIDTPGEFATFLVVTGQGDESRSPVIPFEPVGDLGAMPPHQQVA